MVVSSGEDRVDITDDFRRRMVSGDVTEDLSPTSEVLRGKDGRLGAEGDVGV